jgi:hypothetical protein
MTIWKTVAEPFAGSIFSVLIGWRIRLRLVRSSRSKSSGIQDQSPTLLRGSDNDELLNTVEDG